MSIQDFNVRRQQQPLVWRRYGDPCSDQRSDSYRRVRSRAGRSSADITRALMGPRVELSNPGIGLPTVDRAMMSQLIDDLPTAGSPSRIDTAPSGIRWCQSQSVSSCTTSLTRTSEVLHDRSPHGSPCIGGDPCRESDHRPTESARIQTPPTLRRRKLRTSFGYDIKAGSRSAMQGTARKMPSMTPVSLSAAGLRDQPLSLKSSSHTEQPLVARQCFAVRILPPSSSPATFAAKFFSGRVQMAAGWHPSQ